VTTDATEYSYDIIGAQSVLQKESSMTFKYLNGEKTQGV
jgi:hypothetical protein